MSHISSEAFQPVDHLRWLFLDLNSYFASVEQQENPALRGRPVAVVPAMTDSTCAIAASYEAKAYGIKTGTRIFEAKRLCPSLVCIQADHKIYVDYHHRIMEVLENHIHIDKIHSIDEAACRLTGHECVPENATALAHTIKNSITREIGPAITCSIGVAPNAFLAKIASDFKKPDGLTLFEPHTYKDKLFSLDLMDLPGINRNMRRRLFNAHIYTVEDLYKADPKHIRKIWKSVEGERFSYRLRGYDVPTAPTSKSVIGHSRILDPDLRPHDKAYNVLRHLTVKAASRLRRYDLFAQKIHIGLRFQDRRKWGAERSFSPSQDNDTFLDAVDLLWFSAMHYFGNPDLFKVSISLYGFIEGKKITLDLFETAPKTVKKTNEQLSQSVDLLNKKYGQHTITLGVPPQTQAGFVGTKIAFNRIPESAEFSE